VFVLAAGLQRVGWVEHRDTQHIKKSIELRWWFVMWIDGCVRARGARYAEYFLLM
jgi:hypothetical protein